MGAENGNEERPHTAEDLFDEFLRRREAEGIEFEEFVEQHPRHAEALRALRSMLGERRGADPNGGGGGAATQAVRGMKGSRVVDPLLDRFGRGDAEKPDPLIRERIEGYNLLSILGEGGFGVVYRAVQERPIRRTVAVKVIRLGMDTREVVARFEAEKQALALMDHPSIARIYDAGQTEAGRPFFAMEYIAGVPITDYADRHGLGIRERLDLFIPVCEAVGHAHQKAVIHRDIKPSNVLVTIDGGRPLPKIIDFGVSKALSRRLTDGTFFTEMGQLIGTPAYMSPEQAEMSGLDVDTRTDIYSLGVLLYQLLCGVLPFDPETFRQSSLAEIQRIIRDEDPVRPSSRVLRMQAPKTLRRQLRGDLDWIVMKAMAKDRTRRYGSASDLAADIRRHLAFEPVLAGPPGIGYRVRKLARKHRTAVAVGLAIVIAIAAFSAALRIRAASAFRGSVAATRAAIEMRDLGAARSSLAILLDAHANRADVKALAREVDALESALLSEDSARILTEAERGWSRYRSLRGGVGDIERAWEAWRVNHPSWTPPWEREEEFALHAKLEGLRREIEDTYSEAILQFQRAIEVAPPESEAARAARAASAAAMRALYDTALEEGPVGSGAEFFRRRGTALDPAAFARLGGTVTLRIEPRDAEVYCFRFEEYEKREIPLPFDPRTGAAGEPFLEIERVFDAPPSSFEGGDRLLRAAGEELKLWGDLAGVLATVGPDTPLNVLIERAGVQKTVSWVPYPATLHARFEAELEERDREALRPGRMICPRIQFGFTLRAFPLAPGEGCRLDADPDGRGLQVHLPEGSYLFLIRKKGYADLRISAQIAGRDREVDARMLAEGEIPPGFVYISPGPVLCGGDPLAFQSMPFGEKHLDSFFIGRVEVTFEEYLEFLNDPIEPIGDDGMAAPASEYVRRYATEVLDREKIDLIPRWDSKEALVAREEGGTRWVTRTDEVKSPHWPVFGISQFAAREYAHWRTEKKEAGGRWRYRLPADLEWEKAARGADRRAFVWGDYPLWYYSSTYRGIFRRSKSPEDVGLSPADESVYGVRDLTGSVSEHAIGCPSPPFRYESLRGGNWFNTDDYFGRVATRNGRLPWTSGHNTGFRLVAERRGR